MLLEKLTKQSMVSYGSALHVGEGGLVFPSYAFVCSDGRLLHLLRGSLTRTTATTTIGRSYGSGIKKGNNNSEPSERFAERC